MGKPTPEEHEARRRRKEEGEAARAYLQDILDRVGARMEAERQRRERRRARLRRLTFGLLGR
jgi:hypothetical protein